MIARRPLLVVLVVLCALCGGLALGAVGAGAAVTHEYLSQITEVPAGPGVPVPGPFEAMESMSVDSGHLWIAERYSGGTRADEFDASTGAFVSQLVPTKVTFQGEGGGGGIAVGHATGQAEIYAGARNESAEPVVAVFNEAGTLQATWTGADVPGGSFGGSIQDIAVDNSTNPLDEGKGYVYVAVPERHVIDVFHPEAGGKEKYVTQLTGISPSEPFEFAFKVDVNEANGDVIVLDLLGARAVEVFEPTALGYVFVRKIPVAGAFDLAVDGGSGESNGEIYVTEGFNPVTINEFSSTGALLGRITGADSPGGDIVDVFSLAVDPASHDVYVADNRGGSQGTKAVKVFGPDIVIPDVTTGPTSNLAARSATLTGTVNPHKTGAATCQFVWGATTGFGHVAPCSTAVAEGASPVPVQVSLSGLEVDTNYCYRLQASNAKGANAGEASQDQCFTTAGPGLHAEPVSAVTAESVTFDATINPNKAPTTYYVQYGTTSAYGTSVPAPPGALVGSGEGDVQVSYHVQGLQANTVYHYRVVAVSELGGHVEEFDGSDQAFTTQRSGGALVLPDGRLWEMVTPPQKEGALIEGLGPFFQVGDGTTIQASAGGNAIADVASQPTEAEPRGNARLVSVLSTRGSGGWSSQVIAPSHDEGALGDGSAEYRLFSEDLSRGIVQPFGPFTPLSPEASESTPYVHTDYLNGNVNEHCQVSCFQPLVTAVDTRPGAVFGEVYNGINCETLICGPRFVGATPDLSHVVVSSPVQLTSTPVHTGEGLYEWSGGHLQLVSVLPKSEENTATNVNVTLPGANRQGSQENEREGTRRAISENGERVIFGSRFPPLLYLRDIAKSETVRLDVPQAPASDSSERIEYMTASSDASKVFFLDSGRLTKESSASGPKSSESERKSDLYEYDLNVPSGSRLTDLTVDGHAGEAANVVAVLGASDDGSYVYFAAGGALTPDATPGGCNGEGESEGCNVYVRHNGVTRLVAAGWIDGTIASGWSRVSPDGRWLAFMSTRSLTGHDNRDAVSGHPDAEVYLYDANGRLVCASCDPTGARPVGVDVEPRALWVAANVPGWTHFDVFGETRYQSRYLSDSGRLFFESNDALVPQDVNGAQDVYQYEPPGVGNCTTSSVTFGERSGGCVDLISSGISPEESSFLDASETGGDVFFLTQAKLVSQDFDSAFDVYDAHECTTVVPCYPVSPVSAPVCSTGDSCKAAPSPQPSIFGPAPSATFSGAGNVGPSAPGPVVRGKSSTRAQKLALALKACRKRGRKRRGVCERNARKRYGAAAAGSVRVSAKRKARG